MQAQSTPPQRKYALTKIRYGDYLLPSNDGCTIWRITSYTDGPSFGLDPDVFPTDFHRWRLAKWDRPVDPHRGGQVDVDDDLHWEHVEDDFRTRRDAIKEAMRLA